MCSAETGRQKVRRMAFDVVKVLLLPVTLPACLLLAAMGLLGAAVFRWYKGPDYRG